MPVKLNSKTCCFWIDKKKLLLRITFFFPSTTSPKIYCILKHFLLEGVELEAQKNSLLVATYKCGKFKRGANLFLNCIDILLN
jgi:hypothetical protein